MPVGRVDHSNSEAVVVNSGRTRNPDGVFLAAKCGARDETGAVVGTLHFEVLAG